MRKYRVVAGAAAFISGTLHLTEEQFKAREHALSATKTADEFRILGPVQFKRGEEIGFDGEVSKQLMELLEVAVQTECSKVGKAKVGKAKVEDLTQ